jgi:anti-sigma regulatory factor (Ser/Thr protein kinase)
MSADQARLPFGVTRCTWDSSTSDVARQGRSVLRRIAGEYGLSSETADALILAASELLANAVEHAVGPYGMTVCVSAKRVSCGVRDAHPWVPDLARLRVQAQEDPGKANPVELVGERGRGLRIVDELCGGAWAVVRQEGAKTIWFSLPTGIPTVVRLG